MSSLKDFTSDLLGAIGNNDERQSVSHFLDSGFPPLNKIMTGQYDRGFPYGRIIEIYGPSSSGKTAIATKMMIEAQRAGGVAIFLDHEKAFDVNLAKAMGLNDTFPFWIYKRPKTWEESNGIAMKAAQMIREKVAIPVDAPIVCVLDSVAAAIPQSVYEKGINEYTMNDTTALARVASTTLKAINDMTAEFNVTMVYLNQTRTKPGVAYGDPTTTPGGTAFEFYASIRLALSRSKVVENKDGEKEFTGQQITIEAKKTKLARPFQKTQLRLMFDETGMAYFDVVGGLIDYLVDEKKLAASGPRITWTDGKAYFRKALIDKINSEKLEGELRALLTK